MTARRKYSARSGSAYVRISFRRSSEIVGIPAGVLRNLREFLFGVLLLAPLALASAEISFSFLIERSCS